MPSLRRIPVALHTALRLATGLVTIAVPFVAGFAALPMVLAVVLGTLVVGVSLAAVGAEQADRSALPAPALEALDHGLVVALMLVAVAVAALGAGFAAVILAGIALVQLFGNLTTDYTAVAV